MKSLFALLALCVLPSLMAKNVDEIKTPYGAVPTERQLAWSDMERYAFVHFSLNTFTGREWGDGSESPTLFVPTEYDPEQIIGTLAEAGFAGVVLTAKHHDGFCLWPTKTTPHNVSSSRWLNGKGDIVRDFSRACAKFNVRFGVYLSPWDRNHITYGTPKYVDVYRTQLKELMKNYGDLFIVWHDGAAGGDGFYGGKRETRKVDRTTYYDWPGTWEIVRKMQPGAVIFSDIGPDVRWVGNESGFAASTSWATFTPEGLDGKPAAPGSCAYWKNQAGTVNGKYWIPPEADVSIRPGWFWKASENARVRSPENLLDLYFQSVGRGACLNLNVPPDSRGLIHEKDVESLRGFSKLLTVMYSKNAAVPAKVRSPSSAPKRSPDNVLDRKRETFWMAPSGSRSGEITLNFSNTRSFDVIRLAEPIQLGQRIRAFSVFIKKPNNTWEKWLGGNAIGIRAILQGKPVEAKAVRIVIDKADSAPGLCEVSLWTRPKVVSAPKWKRDSEGNITFESAAGTHVRYTLDGSEPNARSTKSDGKLSLPEGGVLKMIAVRDDGEGESAFVAEEFPMATNRWKISSGSKRIGNPERAIDGDPATLWHTHTSEKELPPPQSVEIDMGRQIDVAAVLYTPRQDGNTNGIVERYTVQFSKDGKSWGSPVAEGEFSNIRANPITQKIVLPKPVSARFLRFTMSSVVDGKHVSIAEIGVIPAEKRER